MQSSFLSCDKIDRVANWVGTTVASAFFASLERCSCITLSSADLDLDDDSEAKDHPRSTPFPSQLPRP